MFVLKKSLTLHNDLSGNLTMKREFYHFAIYLYLENYLFVCGTIPSMFIFDRKSTLAQRLELDEYTYA